MSFSSRFQYKTTGSNMCVVLLLSVYGRYYGIGRDATIRQFKRPEFEIFWPVADLPAEIFKPRTPEGATVV